MTRAERENYRDVASLQAADAKRSERRREGVAAERRQWLAEHGIAPKPNHHSPDQPSRSKAARHAEYLRAKARARGEFVLSPRDERAFGRSLRKLGISDPREELDASTA